MYFHNLFCNQKWIWKLRKIHYLKELKCTLNIYYIWKQLSWQYATILEKQNSTLNLKCAILFHILHNFKRMCLGCYLTSLYNCWQLSILYNGCLLGYTGHYLRRSLLLLRNCCLNDKLTIALNKRLPNFAYRMLETQNIVICYKVMAQEQ